MNDFDPIPRLQQIAATIEDGGHFDAPATAAHYINCAIKEIEQLRKERDDAREQAERWEDDALRLMQERNFAERERDDARFTAAYQYAKHHNGDLHTLMDNFCKLKGWEKIRFFVGDDDHAKQSL